MKVRKVYNAISTSKRGSSMVERELPSSIRGFDSLRPLHSPDKSTVMIYQLVTLPAFSRYNLNYPLFYARTCRVIGLWYKGAYHHAGVVPSSYRDSTTNEQKAAYLA